MARRPLTNHEEPMRLSYTVVIWCAAMAVLLCITAGAQGPPGRRQDSLSITAAPSLVSLKLKSTGMSTASAPISATTEWQIQSGGIQVSLYAYFSDPAAALRSAGGGVIPASRVFGKVGSKAFAPLPQRGRFPREEA